MKKFLLFFVAMFVCVSVIVPVNASITKCDVCDDLLSDIDSCIAIGQMLEEQILTTQANVNYYYSMWQSIEDFMFSHPEIECEDPELWAHLIVMSEFYNQEVQSLNADIAAIQSQIEFNNNAMEYLIQQYEVMCGEYNASLTPVPDPIGMVASK